MANVTTSMVAVVSLIFYVNFVASSLHNIKLDNGQIFKCMDFHKQPAFRNSSVDLQANYSVMSNLAKLQNQESVSGLGLGSRKCPIGKVPILVRSKLKSPVQQLGVHAKQHCSAYVRTTPDPTSVFLGASGVITVYKPNVPASQWSSNRIRLSNTFTETLEAGWMINPDKFGDNEAHLYTSFNALGQKCINLDCPGFVQVSTDIPLGMSPIEYSNASKQVSWNINIAKLDDGNWWLAINRGEHKVGYWPQTLFSTLKDSATQVDFGGEINNLFGVDPPTPMGSGVKAVYDTNTSSFIYRATVIDKKSSTIDLPNIQQYVDCSELYTVLDVGIQGDDLGHVIFYGGPSS